MDCCKKPEIKVFDGWTGWKPGMGTRVVNRICLKCKTHWFGYDDDVTEYTREEWDAMLDRECE